MAIETFEYIDDLNVANPTATDNVSEGDDHLRGLKTTLKNTFPNVTGAIDATEAELNILDGVTATTAELNYVDGVTSNIQTQLDNIDTDLLNDTTPQLGGDLDLNGHVITGLSTDPTMGGDLSGTASNAQIVANAVGTTEIANSAVTDAKIAGMSSSKLSGALPAIDGSALTNLPAGGAWTLIGTVEGTASTSLTVTGLDSTYDTYMIVVSDLLYSSDGQNLKFRLGDSAGIDSGVSDYEFFTQYQYAGQDTYSPYSSTGSSGMVITTNAGNATGEGFGCTLYLNRPADGSTYPKLQGTMAYQRTTGNVSGGFFMGMRKANISVDRVEISSSSANITGRLSVYGVSNV